MVPKFCCELKGPQVRKLSLRMTFAERRPGGPCDKRPRWARNLLRGVWQLSTVDWVGIGLLLIAAPSFGSQVARQWVIAVAIVVYGVAAVGNAVATRGRHVRWCLMSGAIALALMGL